MRCCCCCCDFDSNADSWFDCSANDCHVHAHEALFPPPPLLLLLLDDESFRGVRLQLSNDTSTS
jgi:hypothetical protein